MPTRRKGTPSIDDNHTLFVMTSEGGENNMGIILKIQANGSAYSKLFDFSETTGGNPNGDLLWVEDTFRPEGVLSRRWKHDVAHDIKLYPNPFTSSVTARFQQDDPESVQFIVSDLQGNILQDV